MDKIFEKAFARYPKARKIAVENFTSGYKKMNFEAAMNLGADQQCYRWDSQTVNCIKFVLREKEKLN